MLLHVPNHPYYRPAVTAFDIPSALMLVSAVQRGLSRKRNRTPGCAPEEGECKCGEKCVCMHWNGI